VASGLDRPLYVTHAPGDLNRIFILEQGGVIRVVRDGVLLGTPFIDLTGDVHDGDAEQGLLGMAFHPDYASNHTFYLVYTRADGDSLLRRYTTSNQPDVADPLSGVTILRTSQPATNHNGGWIEFGPDGMLYYARGDGGGSCFGGNTAQNPALLLGKILRLDVN